MTLDPAFFDNFLARRVAAASPRGARRAGVDRRLAARLNWSAAPCAGRGSTPAPRSGQAGLVVTFLVVTLLVVLGILGVNRSAWWPWPARLAWRLAWRYRTSSRTSSAGVYLLLERPFRVGDTIQVKDQTGRGREYRRADDVVAHARERAGTGAERGGICRGCDQPHPRAAAPARGWPGRAVRAPPAARPT